MNTIAYELNNNLYLNVTNSCTNDCVFCIRNKPRAFNEQFQLWLDHEPDEQEVLAAIHEPEKYKEVVFCGYGEPLIRLKVVLPVARFLKSKGCRIRVDTNGTANLIHQRDIVPELVGLVDSVSISLNAHNAEIYEKICHPRYGRKTFEEVLKFAARCKELLPYVQFTVGELPEVDVAQCRNIADNLQIPLKVRKYYEEDYAGFK